MKEQELDELVKRLGIISGMIQMGERIAWGSETALMDEAAAAIQSLREQVKEIRESCLPLVQASIEEYGTDEPSFKDEDDVSIAPSGITFGMIRKAAQALKKAPTHD